MNGEQASERGRVSHGERHYRARLTVEQVHAIRAEYAANKDKWGIQADIARRYGLHPSHVTKLVLGQRWKHA